MVQSTYRVLSRNFIIRRPLFSTRQPKKNHNRIKLQKIESYERVCSPTRVWIDWVAAACYIVNQSPHSTLDGEIPYNM